MMALRKDDPLERAFRKGIRELGRHRPDRALGPLRAAVADCPADLKIVLARRLYWLSMALFRLDRSELALKSLASAQKLRPRGLVRLAYENRANGYGMTRRATPELDDFYAFYSIQVCRYLAGRPGGRFAATTEKDMVTRLIATAWLGLKKSGRLASTALPDRLGIFKAWDIAFPTPLGLSAAPVPASRGKAQTAAACPDPLVVDFRRGRAVKAGDRCPCGSGLSWCRCCGRTQSPLELQN
jgi:hypothetical protein